MDFYKYQGAGNDFVIMENMNLALVEKSDLAVRICDRRFGVGADGFIAAEPSEHGDVKMAFYNADGSEAGMCGNGIRCFAKFVCDTGIIGKDTFTIETGDGEKRVSIISAEEIITEVKVDMGVYSEISPVICSVKDGGTGSRNLKKNDENSRKNRINIQENIGNNGTESTQDNVNSKSSGNSEETAGETEFEVFYTHLGVPHGVIFADTAGEGMKALNDLAERFGYNIEHSEKFAPAGSNVNFVDIAGENHILCSTWERGAGKTFACGTGACSSALAARAYRGLGDSIKVTMPGGEVTVTFDENRKVYMQGTAVLTFKGSIPD